jgi:hypothetical protein
MPARCPWCLEPLSRSQRLLPECPFCERPLAGPSGEPTELGLRYHSIEARQQKRAREVLTWGVPAIVVLAATASLLHVGGLVLAPLVAAVHLIVLRFYVVREGRRYLGPIRRLFTRWSARFAFLWLGLPGYASMVVPLAGVVVGIATFVVLTEVVHVYGAWSLEREHARQPLLGWEKALMATAGAVTVVAVAVAVVVVVVIGWSTMALVDWLRPD